MVLYFAILLAAVQDIPGLRAYHPGQPDRVSTTYEVTCGSLRLRIDNYGHSRPAGTAPRLFLNRRRLTGALATTLERDLSDPRAAYRLSSRCDRRDGYLQLEVHKGKRVSGNIEFQVSAATFTNRGIVFHGPAEVSNEDTFWFS